MNKLNLFDSTFLLSYLTALIGAMLKILHLSGGELLLSLGLLTTIAYVIIALYQIYNSDHYTTSQKLRWTIGFILFFVFAGMLYFLKGRRKIQIEY
jgi:hypothetical protein